MKTKLIESNPAALFALRVHATGKDSGYGHIKAYACAVDLPDDSDNPQPQNADRYDCPMQSLALSAQCDEGSNGLYGYRFGLQDYSYDMVTCEEATRISRLLAPVIKRMDKMYASEGDVLSIGSYINRVARATGAQCIYVRRPQSNYRGHDWTRYSLGDAVQAINTIAHNLILQVNPNAKLEGSAYAR